MPIRKVLIALGVLFAVLLIVGLSPLVDGDAGWKSTLGDIVWSGIFLMVAALIVLGVVALVRGRRAPQSGS